MISLFLLFSHCLLVICVSSRNNYEKILTNPRILFLHNLQDEVQVAVDINKASLYRIVFYYHNPGFNNINADVTVTPERSTEATQSGNIILPSTAHPEHQSVLNTFVLNSGRWTISLKTPERLYVVCCWYL